MYYYIYLVEIEDNILREVKSTIRVNRLKIKRFK